MDTRPIGHRRPSQYTGEPGSDRNQMTPGLTTNGNGLVPEADAGKSFELPVVPGYVDLRPIYPYYYNSVSMYRAKVSATDEPVLIKVSTSGSLEDLTRIRHEWSIVYPQGSVNSSIDLAPGILRPERCLRICDNPAKVVLVYPDHKKLVTLREKYISPSLPLEPFKTSAEDGAGQRNGNAPKLIERDTSELREILSIIILVLQTISKIHDDVLTHNRLTSSTIFIDEDGDTYVSGWDFSFQLRAEDTSRGYRKTHLKQITDCISYVSPETTCLVNRLVDFRADFYSIGCILYELLLGHLPFRSSDPSEISRMQVLRTPIAPSLLATWVPKPLSRIIMKLLEKNADDRYQSARLIISDLETVRDRLDSGTFLEDDEAIPGPLKSVSPLFMVPQVIYGRESELAILQTVFKRSNDNDFQFLFVIGEPGSGKSRLVGELERSAIASNGFFSVTKYDEYQRGPPFYTIVTVLKGIVHQILSGSVESITQWRDTIVTNLKVDLAALFDPIPELKELLGYEYLKLLPKSRLLGPVSKEMQFKFVVKSLFCLFGSQGLTVFLDDIQWCPPSELSLFRELSLFANENYEKDVHITFVCASTPESFNSYSGLARMANELKGRYEEIQLKPLSFEAVREIVNDTLGISNTRHSSYANRRRSQSKDGSLPYGISVAASSSARQLQGTLKPPSTEQSSMPIDPQVQSLSETLYDISNGNPLLISWLLHYLYYEQYIYYENANRLTGGAKWRVDFDALKVSSFPTSVADVVIRFMDKLPSDTNSILKYAACICSNSFTLEDLAIGANVSFSQAASALKAALDLQLLMPTSIHCKFPFFDPVGTTNIELYDDEIRRVAGAATYRFYHDVVQQAVYSRLEKPQALEVHRLIGLRLLRADNLESMSTHRILEIANQLKNAASIVKEGEKSTYIELNIMAGNKVYAMSDFDKAYTYFETAWNLLPVDAAPEVSQEIKLKLVELQYNRSKFDDCIRLVDGTSSSDVVNKAALLRIKSMALYGQGKVKEAISIGLDALTLLGFELCDDDEWNIEYSRKLQPRIPISAPEIRELANFRKSTNPRYVLVQQIISTLSIQAYLATQYEVLKSLVFTSVTVFLESGPTGCCCFSLLSLANLFHRDGGTRNLTLAYEYSKLAIVISESDENVNTDFGLTIYEYYALTLGIFFEPISEVIRYYDVVLLSDEVIEVYYGNVSLSYDLRTICRFLAGEPVKDVIEYFERRKLPPDNEMTKLWMSMHTQLLLNITGSSDTSNLDGVFSSAMGVDKPEDASAPVVVKYAYYVMKLVLAVLHRYKYVAADIISSHLPELIEKTPVTVYHILVTFYGALALIDKSDKTKAEKHQLGVFSSNLENWTKQCPSLFLHKHLLIKAEMNAESLSSICVLDIYEEAIVNALNGGFIHEAALINERCGEYLQAHSKQRSLAYFKEACRLYNIWGANKKVSYLSAKYAEMPSPAYELSRMNFSSTDLHSSASVTGMHDHRQKGQLQSGNFLLQNSSPLRWILSNLFHDDTGAQQPSRGEDRGTAVDGKRKGNNSLLLQTLGYGNSEQSESHDVELKIALQDCVDISESIYMDAIVRKVAESVMRNMGADYCAFISIDEGSELYADAAGVLNGVNIIPHEPLIIRTDVAPINLVQHVISTGSPVNRSDDPKKFDNTYGQDHYLHQRQSRSVLCMPIQNQIKIIGALYLEQQSLPQVFTNEKIERSALLCTAAAVSIEKARLYIQMDLAKKAAEEATAEKASFLANMSHEIRTPFNALLSCSIFLLDTALDDTQREYVETIRSSAMLTLNIIDAILAFSKIEHGSITLDNSPFSLRECVESAIQLVAEPAATKDLELVHLNRCGEMDLIHGDVTRVRQIIINLVGNAVKFTSKGHIVVETTVEKVSSDNRYEFVISVSDTGIGIPENARSKIFRAFSQVDGSSRRAYGGSGLGLAISKKLAEIMGGNLTFESREGQGTTFWFNLVATAEQPPEKKLRAYVGKRCIVADAHQTAKESLKTEIERLGFEVDLCSSSRIAAEQVQAHPPNYYSLVFIDSKLMTNSFSESQQIRRHSPDSQVVYMTIFGVTVPDNMTAKGISAMLMRPVQRSRLTQIIGKILDSSWDISNQVRFVNTTHDKGMLRSLAVRHPLKILLAEDNIINTRVALQHLKRMGYDADHAKDGVEVLNKCAEEVAEGRGMYDCILMDIQMPRKDGIAAAQELNENYWPQLRPSVIALTANTAGEDRQRCLECGMINYIAKPILPSDLAAVLMGVKPLKERNKQAI